MSKNDAPIQFRKTVPNSATENGSWPRVNETEGDHRIDAAHDAFRALFDSTLLPTFLGNNQGNVMRTAESLSILFAGFLHNFLADNVEEGEKKTYLRVHKAVGACFEYSLARMKVIHAGQAMGLPQPLISLMLHEMEQGHAAPDVKVFTIKPGDKLPQEITDILKGN